MNPPSICLVGLPSLPVEKGERAEGISQYVIQNAIRNTKRQVRDRSFFIGKGGGGRA